ncbi:hypothetical protein [Mycobacterium sp.]|jgi:hypothetical protein|uniref:hypothetical protein n=1 Tax=Mycobacterium sp. TaxID=1785 RepID=UPI002D41FD12|nr:hypothetical protein [Mycobacterium sp.]HZA11031.1 hypothetical protein [Mycobacterium sp.]
MTIRFGYLIAAGAAAAILSAPTASAASAGQACTDVGSSGTECSSPGNVQINDAPPVVDPGVSGVYPGPYAVPWDEGSR